MARKKGLNKWTVEVEFPSTQAQPGGFVRRAQGWSRLDEVVGGARARLVYTIKPKEKNAECPVRVTSKVWGGAGAPAPLTLDCTYGEAAEVALQLLAECVEHVRARSRAKKPPTPPPTMLDRIAATAQSAQANAARVGDLLPHAQMVGALARQAFGGGEGGATEQAQENAQPPAAAPENPPQMAPPTPGVRRVQLPEQVIKALTGPLGELLMRASQTPQGKAALGMLETEAGQEMLASKLRGFVGLDGGSDAATA